MAESTAKSMPEKKLGFLGYLLILIGAVLMNFSPFFGVISVFGFVLAAIAWLDLGSRSREKVMVGNGMFMLIFLAAAFVLPVAALLFGNVRILVYGMLALFAITFVSLFFDLASHLRAYRRFKAKGFLLGFVFRIMGILFSIYLISSLITLLRANSFSNVFELTSAFSRITPQVSVMAVVVVLANLFSALGFYELR